MNRYLNLAFITLALAVAMPACLVVGEADVASDGPSASDTTAAGTTGVVTERTTMDTADTGRSETDRATDGTTGTTDTTEPPTSEIPVPLAGRYRRVDVSNINDTCGFMTAATFGLTYDELYDFYLPNAARLQPDDAGFLWQEDDSGRYSLETDDAVLCEMEGSAFACTNQNARQPTTYSQTLFCVYEVEVSGRVESKDILETDVTVTYLEMDTFSSAYLAAVGIDFRDCQTSLTMRWALQE